MKVLDVSDLKELSTSAIPPGIECGGGDSPGSGEHVTSIEVSSVCVVLIPSLARNLTRRRKNKPKTFSIKRVQRLEEKILLSYP